jgi:radical SAM superfamily enzyme YgiQ (UPF0313 family)
MGPAPRRRVLLVNPPGLRGRTNDRSLSGGIGVSRRLKPLERARPELLAIDVLYLAAAIEQAGAPVLLEDLLLERLHGARALRHCLQRCAAGEASETWVGVRLSMPSLVQDLQFADALKRARPALKVFVFGTVIMTTVDHWIRASAVDWVLYGEPEAFIADMLAAPEPASVPGVLEPRRYQPLQGDALFDEAQITARKRDWRRVAALAGLPRPAWHLLDLARYAGGRDKISELGVFIQASRGCPIDCTMCPYALLEGARWRSNDVARVVSEIAYLNERHGIYRVRFRDPNFGFNRKYARELAEALIARKVKLAASIESSVEVFDDDTLSLLRRAGIDAITTGVESNDAECLASIGGNIKVNDKLRARIATCHRLGFHVYGTYCLGTPEETWATVEKTWRFANELDIESGFTVMTPFPGTPMYFRGLREGLLLRRMRYADWNSYRATMRSYALSTRDLDVARYWARMETILPYRRKRARGARALADFYVKHAPHYALRTACRAYVAVRKRSSAPQPSAAPSLAG